MKLLASDSIAGSSFIAQIPPGTYKAFYLHLVGVPSTDVLASDIGTVRLLVNGRDRINANYQDLLERAKVRGGSVLELSTTATSFSHQLPIPRHYNDGNVETIEAGDQAQFTLTYGASMGTLVSSGTIELYGVTRKTGTQLYQHKLIGIQDAIGGAGTFPLHVAEENILAIYPRLVVRTTNALEANLDRIRAEVDGQEVCNATALALQYKTYNDRNVDSGETAKLGEIDAAQGGSPGEYLSDKAIVEVTTGGAMTFDMLIEAADFDLAKYRASRARSGEHVDLVLRRKEQLGKVRPVQVLEAASGIVSRV